MPYDELQVGLCEVLTMALSISSLHQALGLIMSHSTATHLTLFEHLESSQRTRVVVSHRTWPSGRGQWQLKVADN